MNPGVVSKPLVIAQTGSFTYFHLFFPDEISQCYEALCTTPPTRTVEALVIGVISGLIWFFLKKLVKCFMPPNDPQQVAQEQRATPEQNAGQLSIEMQEQPARHQGILDRATVSGEPREGTRDPHAVMERPAPSPNPAPASTAGLPISTSAPSLGQGNTDQE